MRKVWASLVALSFVVVVSGPARAGGAVLDFDQEFYVPGDVVRAESAVWLRSSMGRLDDGPYFAYVSGPSRRIPWPIPPDAIRVAPVDVVPRPDPTYGDATIEFVVPELSPGQYWVSVCNSPCRVTLGDIVPSPLVVAANESEGRVAMATERLSERIRSLRVLVVNRVLGRRADSLRGRVAALERDVAHLLVDLHELRAAARREPASDSSSSSLSPLLAFVVPAAALAILAARRSRKLH